jgi:hypothetical protein
MTDLGAVVAQLKAERTKLDRAIEALSGITGNSGSGGGKRRLSAAARARIAAAQRARWAKVKKKKGWRTHKTDSQPHTQTRWKILEPLKTKNAPTEAEASCPTILCCG